jgi:solute carrier family 35 (UDP-sugar transporter), member A1/2/3
MAPPPPTSLKYASLCVLCLQNSLLAILMRLSRVGDHPKFNASTAVVMGEVLKVAASAVLIMWSPPAFQDPANKGHAAAAVGVESSLSVIFDGYELLRVSVPALLYVIQNNLQYVAVSNLDAAAFQVLYQLKILTTAMFSVVLLRKTILPQQWGAIMLLMGGVGLVQLDESGPKKHASADQNTLVGLMAVLASCMCSGFAGVYFEKILKNASSKGSIWERNVQMGLISIFLGVVGLWFNDYDHVTMRGFFYGYRPVVWWAIAVSALGGLLTAVVVKYADNILKAFATSIAIVLSVIMSVFLFDKIPTLQFAVGAAIVNVSVYLYGTAPARQQAKSANPVMPTTTPHRGVQ